MLRRLFEAICYVFAGPETHSEFRAFLQSQVLVAAENKRAARSPVGAIIPEAKRAELRKAWDAIGSLEPVDEAARGPA
jgi:hypothetical protein